MPNSDDNSAGNQSDSSLHDDIAPPPQIVNLPKPDGLDDPNQRARVNKEKKKKKKRRAKERQHPTDAYEPIKNARRGCGCFGYLLLLLFVIAAAIGWMGWQLQEEFVTEKGFEWINVKSQNLVTAPEAETVYLGAKVSYEAPETAVEAVFAGGLWWLSGTFHEKVYFKGIQLNLEPDARFLNGLHVDALLFDASEAEIQGEITGKILKQK